MKENLQYKVHYTAGYVIAVTIIMAFGYVWFTGNIPTTLGAFALISFLVYAFTE